MASMILLMIILLRNSISGSAGSLAKGKAAESGAGAILPPAADRVFRRHRQRARDGMAGGGFTGAARVSGSGTGPDASGSLDDIAHAAADRCGNPSSGVRLGAEVAGGERF